MSHDSDTDTAEREGQRVEQALSLAAELLRDIAPTDARLKAVVQNEPAASFTGVLTDEVLRLREPRAAAARFRRAVAAGVPRAFPVADRVLLRAGAVATRIAPALVMRLVNAKLRAASSGQVLPLADPGLARRLSATHASGAHTNISLLGEAIVGEEEAVRRRDAIANLLARSDVDAVSVKLSAVAANISALAFDATVERLTERLSPVYRAAVVRSQQALVTLDMEEYRDLRLTAAVFQRSLTLPEFRELTAGIVLQAYLPDSHEVAEALAQFALERRAAGGAPIRIRLVKGANLAMEHVEAELRGWPLAPYGTKSDVDASYKRLLDSLLRPELDGAVIVGLASHNLFDIAWGMGCREVLASRGAADRLEFETLEGMARGLAAGIARRGAISLVYSPVVDRDSFDSAIAYLVRRLDENTSPDNFLHALVDLRPDSPAFDREAKRFVEAVTARHTIDTASRRATPLLPPPSPARLDGFHNEPDTDFALADLRDPILEAVRRWRPPSEPIRPIIGGRERTSTDSVIVIDPSTGDVLATVELADAFLVDETIAVSRSAFETWSTEPAQTRRTLLLALADAIASQRGAIIATMVHETAKTVAQGDPEVSEAVDFARYYADSISLIDQLAGDGLSSSPRGVVVVAPPWNFPFAILMGGVCASLAAGNVVVIKPAPQAILCAQMVAECCWIAGIPADVVQFLPCPDNEVGQRLIAHPDVNVVLLTGSIDTARLFLSWRPDLCVMAETSGKNTMVITASADIDLALKDLVASAFGHAGQKCSAASLAVLAPCWYDNPDILSRLADAVRSLHAGPASDPETDIAPMTCEPSPHLRRALTTTAPGERWLVKPVGLDDTGHHWTPGVLLGVQPGSWFHQTECFGPVLGVLRADDLDAALDIQNAVDFGLTAGLHSLDPIEIERWTENVQAGNLYINRTITGAIVRRQPFGGWKRSSVGPGAKAGGASHVMLLRNWTTTDREPDELRAAESFSHWWHEFFGIDSDPSALSAERNVLRHRPLPNGIALRIGPGAPEQADAVARCAAAITGTRLVTSIADDESDTQFAERLAGLHVDRVRLVGAVDDVVRIAAHRLDITVDDAALTDHGRVELPHWLREQTVTITLHRHGHIRG